jgi:hypothetical protein
MDNQRASQSIKLEAKMFVEKATVLHWIDTQKLIIRFLLVAYGFLLVVTMGMFLLQGFRLEGFNLDRGLLMWLGGATVGTVGGLLTLTFGAVFKKLKD